MSDTTLDFRLRPPFQSLLHLNIWRLAQTFPRFLGWEPEASQKTESMSDCLAEMEAANVTQGVVSGRVTLDSATSASNEDIAALVDQYEEFIGFGAVGVSSSRTSEDQAVNALSDLRLKGLTIEPGYEGRYADDPGYLGAYEVASSYGVPVVITLSALLGPDLGYASPVPVSRIAARYPDLQIVISHGAWPYITEAFGVAFKHNNVWVMPDFYTFGMPGYESVLAATRTGLVDRIIYGSAYPLLPISESVERFRMLGLPNDVERKILSQNGSRLLGV